MIGKDKKILMIKLVTMYSVVCVDDELVDMLNGHKCWLLNSYDGLYIRYDNWLSSTMSTPDITNIKNLSNFTITKRHSIF